MHDPMKVRDERLSMEWFYNRHEAQDITKDGQCRKLRLSLIPTRVAC